MIPGWKISASTEKSDEHDTDQEKQYGQNRHELDTRHRHYPETLSAEAVVAIDE